MLRKWLFRLTMPASILAVFIYLIVRYTEIKVIEETTRSLPMPILFVLVIFAMIVGAGGSVLALALYIKEIKADPMSIKLFGPIIVLMISVVFILRITLNKVESLILLNVDRLLEDIMHYNESTLIVIGILVAGFILGLIGYLYEQGKIT